MFKPVARIILGFSDLLLDLANSLVELAFGLQALVASQTAGGILERALDLLAYTFDFILVHESLLCLLWEDNGPAPGAFR